MAETKLNLIRFMNINAPSPYNIIFERTTMHKFRVIASTIIRVFKFHAISGVGVILTKKRERKMKQDHGKNDTVGKINNTT